MARKTVHSIPSEHSPSQSWGSLRSPAIRLLSFPISTPTRSIATTARYPQAEALSSPSTSPATRAPLRRLQVVRRLLLPLRTSQVLRRAEIHLWRASIFPLARRLCSGQGSRRHLTRSPRLLSEFRLDERVSTEEPCFDRSQKSDIRLHDRASTEDPCSSRPQIGIEKSYMEASSQESRGPGHNKRNWSEQEDLKLIEAMLDLHNMGTYNAEGGFKPGFFNAVEKILVVSLPQSGIKADPHIRSRVKTLKGHFAIVHDMLYGPNTSGFGYDDTTKSVVAEKPVWDAYIQSHKKAAMFKDKPFQFYRELCIIFGKDRATGANAETAADAVEELEREAATMTPTADDDFDMLVDGIETMDFGTSPDPTSIDNTSDAGSSRRKRKKKTGKSVEETIFEITERSTTTMVAQMDKTADKISRAIQDGNVQDLRGKLNAELSKVVGLTRGERLRALTKIGCDRAITTLFFTLEDEDKEEYIRSIIE